MKVIMTVEKIEEAGYKAALHGLSFNKKQEKDMTDVAQKLASKDYGHNKFLESIYIWIEVTAPRYWWQEADTFRLSTKQSESTMHTLIKELQNLDKDDESALAVFCMFEDADYIGFFETMKVVVDVANSDTLTEREKLVIIKQRLPEGFLQRRLWCMNYKCLRNIIIQRKNHRLPHWQSFIKQVINQIDHPELFADIWNQE